MILSLQEWVERLENGVANSAFQALSGQKAPEMLHFRG